MIALFCGLGFLLGAGIFIASKLGRALQFQAPSGITMRTAAGDLRVEKPNETGPGLPVYPEAGLVLPGTVPAKSKTNETEEQTSIYHTSDPSEFVDSWYVKHLGPEFVRSNAGDKTSPDIPGDVAISNSDITFVGEREDQVRIVAIAMDAAGTKITLVRSNKHKDR